MLKISFFQGNGELGPAAIPLFGPADSFFEKTAAPSLQAGVVRYVENLRPQKGSQYVLVNAMGAGEFYGSNINGDHFSEASLIHKPNDWKDNPVFDRALAKKWSYGFPTFYNAHPFAHHRNKDPSRAFGEVELAVWNDSMKRVELVCRVDEDKCHRFNGTAVWDKLIEGQFPDVSMGTKVPFDTCSICLDWEEYRKAIGTFDPAKHRHAGESALRYHKAKKAKDGKGIRGLSVTRSDYCEHAKNHMNRIYPDGRKVWVYNDFPRFFDISFVFIGADKTAKVMLKIAEGAQKYWFVGSSTEVAEKLGYVEKESLEKTAAVDELKLAFLGKAAKDKKSEIIKTVPSQFASKAVPALTKQEPDIPKDTLDTLAGFPLEKVLSTLSGLGMVMKPKEFQRIVIIKIGKKPLADSLESQGEVFPKTDEIEPMSMDPGDFSSVLARLLLPMLSARSGFGPVVEKRVVMLSGQPEKSEKSGTSHPSDLLRKIGAAYNGYRQGLMQHLSSAQSLMEKAAGVRDSNLHELVAAKAEDLITPLSFTYFNEAFLDEIPVGDSGSEVVKISEQAIANV